LALLAARIAREAGHSIASRAALRRMDVAYLSPRQWTWALEKREWPWEKFPHGKSLNGSTVFLWSQPQRPPEVLTNVKRNHE
jgi:hypothetical protein